MGFRIKANHACQIPTLHLVFDCETRPIPHPTRANRSTHLLRTGSARFFRWDAGKISREREYVFKTPGEWADIVEAVAQERKGLWVWAHNLGFDLSAVQFWSLCESGRFCLFPPVKDDSGPNRRHARAGMFVTQDPPTIIQFRTIQGELVTAVDSLNYLSKPLAEIGRLIGLGKLKMPGWGDSEEEWERYCARDTEILARFVQQLLATVRECDLGNLRTTSAGQAWAAWRHTKPTPVVDVHQPDNVKADERNAYYGARNWVYLQARITSDAGPVELVSRANGRKLPVWDIGPVTRLDVISHYPNAMLRNVYPSRYLRTVFSWEPSRLERAMLATCAVAHVKIVSREVPYPVRREAGVIWSVGAFSTWLCGPELLRALRDGHVTHVYTAHLYTADRILDAFAHRMIAHRMQAKESGNDLRAALCKAIANALHGKFGQRPGSWEYDPEVCAPFEWGSWSRYDLEAKQATSYRAIAGKTQRKVTSGERDESFPAIAAFVASYAREWVRQWVVQAGPLGVVYEDADTIHVTRNGLARLRHVIDQEARSAGMLRVVGSSDNAEYRGLKDYTFGGRDVVSGLTGEAIEAYPDKFRFDQFQGLNCSLASRPEDGPQVDQVVKDRPCGRIPGAIRDDGVVLPLIATD